MHGIRTIEVIVVTKLCIKIVSKRGQKRNQKYLIYLDDVSDYAFL